MSGLWKLYVRTRDLKWRPINRDTKASSTNAWKHLNMSVLTFFTVAIVNRFIFTIVAVLVKDTHREPSGKLKFMLHTLRFHIKKFGF
jgi:hypothetical protein